MICIFWYWMKILRVMFCVHLVPKLLSITVLYKWPTFIGLKVSHYSKLLYHFFNHWNLLTQFIEQYTKGVWVLSLWGIGHLIWPDLHLNSYFNRLTFKLSKNFIELCTMIILNREMKNSSSLNICSNVIWPFFHLK